MTKKKHKPSSILRQVREPKYRQRVIPDKKKELKKNPPQADE